MGDVLKFRIRYIVRGDWTVVDVIRDDLPPEEPDITRVIVPNDPRPPIALRGRALFRTNEWNLLYCKLGFKGPIGHGGERAIEIP